MYNKLKILKSNLQKLESVAVSFSGGVDSTFLLKVAHNVLGDNAIAITAKTYSFPLRELEETKKFCDKEKIKHIVFEFDELNIEGFKQNPRNRCYICKKELFNKIINISKQNNIKNVIEGSNADDDMDYRPGLKAITEMNVKSPLKEAGLTKQDIRLLSKEIGLSTWNKQSLACLSSRFVYGETITKEKIHMVDRAEQFLIDKGFKQVRVRIHGKMARIEIMPEEFNKIIQEDIRVDIINNFKSYGFTYVTMDLKGYRTGSMNENFFSI